ncbi:MAG: 6-carboxytetrahydropterin synthase [Nannocystaceae bacterium]
MRGPYLTTLELYNEAMAFSAGHFTIFSATERERLHGHNFLVYAAITGIVGDNGLLADYSIFKRLLVEICRSYDKIFLLPGLSPHLEIREDGDHLEAIFDGVAIPFLRKDVLVLPLSNVSVEELARVIADRLVDETLRRGAADVTAITVKISSNPGQSGSYAWKRESTE